MAVRSTYSLLTRHPHPILTGRVFGPERLVPTQTEEMQDILTRALSRVRGDDDTALASDNPTTPSTIALYRINHSAGDVFVAGILGSFSTGTDVVLIGAGEWGKSHKLDGSAAVVLSADGKTYDMAVVAVIVDGAVELHAVFGDEADDGAEVEPDDEAIATALSAASITDLYERAGLVLMRIKVQRVAVDTISMTHVDPAADAALAEDRSAGNVFGVVA